MDPENEGTPLKAGKQKNILLSPTTQNYVEHEGLLGKIGGLFFSLLFSLIVLAILNALSIASIVIGGLYFDKNFCPAEVNLAPVLIASGALAVLLSIFEGRTRLRVARRHGDDLIQQERDGLYWPLNFFRLAKFVVFVYLCYLVFSLYPNVKLVPYTPTPAGTQNFYCHPTLYLFSFYTIILVFVTFGVAMLMCCCVCCFAALLAASARD